MSTNTSTASSSSPIPLQISFQGKSFPLEHVTATTTSTELVQRVRDTLQLAVEDEVKILYKGKNIAQLAADTIVFPQQPQAAASSRPLKPIKLLVTATRRAEVDEIQNKRSDPTIRGFDNERNMKKDTTGINEFWGTTGQDRNYKFCHVEACPAFYRNSVAQQAPHIFQATQLLEKITTDPGIVAIMKERELVVHTLGEMDPIDDRLMQKKQQAGACLLGYNTNHGFRIDVRLRSFDLQSFLPYHQIVATVIHEISHNWFGEHDLYFWTNYGQMRAEYLYTHYLQRSHTLWQGRTSAQIADLPALKKPNQQDLCTMILQELQQEMAQHGLHPQMIASAIEQRCQELDTAVAGGNKLGGGAAVGDGNHGGSTGHISNGTKSPRVLALEAAERRAREQKEKEKANMDQEKEKK